MNEDRKAQEHTPTEENDEPREERVEDLDVPEDQGKEVKGGLNFKIEIDG